MDGKLQTVSVGARKPPFVLSLNDRTFSWHKAIFLAKNTNMDIVKCFKLYKRIDFSG
jgi:hypothetical protein